MTIAVDCPHPKCRGTLKLAEALPAGVYLCICHACDVRWDGTTVGLAGCVCPCHQVIQPGLVPCPYCDGKCQP